MRFSLRFSQWGLNGYNKYLPSLEAIEEARKMNLNLLIFPGEEVSAYDGNEGGMHLLS